jgi:hypothetical protein
MRRLPLVALCFLLPALCAGQASRGLELGTVKSLPAAPARFALVIGVDQYDDTQLSTLGGAANDAEALARALTRFAGFPADQVVVLASNQPAERRPTRGNIMRRLSNMKSLVPRDGLLLVAFSGHGIEREGRAFLLPSDAQVNGDLALLEDTAISVESMKTRIQQTGVGQVVVLLDACRNDPAGRADAANPLTPAFTRGFDFEVRNREVTAFATIYATAVGERAFEFREKRQGYFTWALVRGLEGAAANDRGEVTLAALVKYVQEVVPKQVTLDLGSEKRQRPFAVVEGYRADELVLSITTARGPGPGVPGDLDLAFWESIKSSADPADYRAYLEKFPNGTYAELARRRAERPAPVEARSYAATMRGGTLASRNGMAVAGNFRDVFDTSVWGLKGEGSIWRVFIEDPLRFSWTDVKPSDRVELVVEELSMAGEGNRLSGMVVRVNGAEPFVSRPGSGFRRTAWDVTKLVVRGPNVVEISSLEGTDLVHGVRSVEIVYSGTK